MKITVWYQGQSAVNDNLNVFELKEFESAQEAQGWMYSNAQLIKVKRITSDDLMFKTEVVQRPTIKVPPLPKKGDN